MRKLLKSTISAKNKRAFILSKTGEYFLPNGFLFSGLEKLNKFADEEWIEEEDEVVVEKAEESLDVIGRYSFEIR